MTYPDQVPDRLLVRTQNYPRGCLVAQYYFGYFAFPGSLPKATRPPPGRPPVAGRPAPPAPTKQQNGASSQGRRQERERRELENDASSVSTAGAVGHEDYVQPGPPTRKESVNQLAKATAKVKISNDTPSSSQAAMTNGASPTKIPHLQKKPAVIGGLTAKELAEAPHEVVLTTKERLPNGKQVEEKTVVAPAPLDGPAAAAAALEKPYQPTNVRYSTMSEEQIMYKLKEIVNKEDPKHSYSMIKKIGQG